MVLYIDVLAGAGLRDLSWFICVGGGYDDGGRSTYFRGLKQGGYWDRICEFIGGRVL